MGEKQNVHDPRKKRLNENKEIYFEVDPEKDEINVNLQEYESDEYGNDKPLNPKYNKPEGDIGTETIILYFSSRFDENDNLTEEEQNFIIKFLKEFKSLKLYFYGE